jgi:glycine betaine/proline transport system substrate-binding protein
MTSRARSSMSVGVVLFTLALASIGCGGSSPENRELTLGDIGWDENVAVANLTKALLEDEIGYENVELQTLDVGLLYEGVGTGDLDAFQDVWLPAHRSYLGDVEDDVERLDSWFLGTTRFGIAAPSYMGIESLDQLNGTGADEILGIEPGAVSMEKIPDSVIPAYDLQQTLTPASTPTMLSELERRVDNGEEFAFIAWSPHWMNQRYDFVYLEDPQDAFEEVDDTVELSTIVNEDLPEDDPVAYAFLDAITLTEEQVNDLENVINEVGDPLEGARQWAEENPDVVEPWLEAAQNAQQ